MCGMGGVSTASQTKTLLASFLDARPDGALNTTHHAELVGAVAAARRLDEVVPTDLLLQQAALEGGLAAGGLVVDTTADGARGGPEALA